MPITSGQIAQGFSAQQAMFGGQMAYAQQLSYPMQASLNPGMAPPPPPSAAAGFMNAQPAGFGQVGEQMAASAMSTAAMVGGTGLAGAQMYGMMGGGGALGMAGRALDPFTHVMGAGRAGMGMGARMGMGAVGRGAMGAAFGGAAALPLYAGYKAAETYVSAFTGGMQNQAGLNSQLRSNFRHFGGGGAHGRGFSQQQMGQIGMDVAQTVRNDPMMSMGQATQLIGRGAQAGMMTGVRGASEFNQKFRQMLDTLKGVQRELGGSLNEAMDFVTEARQSGVFQTADRLRLAAGQRTTTATTGLNSMQQAQMTQFGSQLSRSVGGRAAQGAFGAQRAMQQIGSAVQSGALNEEQIFEMTGQTGAQGQMMMGQQMMQTTARLSRRAHGRYGIFGLSNREGTGLDEAQMARFAAGDIGAGELSRRAHRNVGRMGRARAINREGRLRGAALEQGGVGFQIGMMRQIIGDRGMDQGDDMASLVIQRRMGVDRPQAEAMMSMMRNQGAITRQENLGRVGAVRQASSARQLQERGMDAQLDQLGQTMSNRLQVTATEEAGQRAMTRISSLIERAMNDMLGVVDHQMTGGTAAATSMASIGRASQGQRRRIEQLSAASAEEAKATGGGGRDPFGRGLMEMPTWMGGSRTEGEALEAFGFDVSGYGSSWGAEDLATTSDLGAWVSGTTGVRDRLRRERGTPMSAQHRSEARLQVSMAMQGQVQGGAQEAMERLVQDPTLTARMDRASILAHGARQRGGLEGTTLFEQMEGGGGSTKERLAMTAIMARQGTLDREGLTDPSGMRGGEGETTGGMYARDALRIAGQLTGGVIGRGAVQSGLEALGFGGGAREMGSEVIGQLEGRNARPGGVQDRNMRALDYISAGGQLRRGATAEQRENIAASHGAIGREAFQAAYEDETISGIIGEISAASASGDVEATTEQIAALRRHGTTLEGTQGEAVRSIVSQMTTEQGTNEGRISRRHISGTITKEDMLAFRQEAGATGRSMSRIGMSIQGDSPMAQRLREQFGTIGTQQQSHGQEEAGYEGTRSMMENIAMMDEDEQQEAMALIGGGSITGQSPEAVAARAQRRAVMGEQASRNRLQRDLQGGGRRGQRQARETALSMITGGTSGGMEFELNGRQIRSRNQQQVIAQALSGQGNMSDEARQSIRDQLVQQMQTRGISGAEDLVNAYAEGLQNEEGDEGRGNLSAEEASRLRASARKHGGDIGEAQREELEARQQAANPLDATRNETLNQILIAIRANNNGKGGDGDTPDTPETPGSR